MWVVNAKIPFVMKWLEKLGFEFLDSFAWVKLSKVKAVPMNSNGGYTRHSKELCFLFKKGNPAYKAKRMQVNDTIISKFTG